MFKTFHLKLIRPDEDYFGRLFAEAKWWVNAVIEQGLEGFDTKQKVVAVKRGPKLDVEPITALSSQMKQGLYQRLWDNIKGLSAKKQKGAKVGRLKFKRFVNSVPLKNQTLRLEGKKVRFQGSKVWFHLRGSEHLPKGYDLRSATLIRKDSGIYLDVCVEYSPPVSLKKKPKPKFIGLDMGVRDTLTFHDGTTVNFASSELEEELKTTHFYLSRSQSKSKRRFKLRKKLRKLEERLYNQKVDAVNKLISRLKDHIVCFQDECLDKWQQQFGMKTHKTILGRVKAALKQSTANQMVEREKPTTQFCPQCHKLNKLPLSQRTYTCSCGYTRPRDAHAASNMFHYTGADRTHELSCVYGVLSTIQHKQLSIEKPTVFSRW